MGGSAIWFVGLPGSGKSSLACAAVKALLSQGFPAVYLELDSCRKIYAPNALYAENERERVYALFVKDAVRLVRQGKVVVMDGSAHKRAMRDLARAKIEHFAEIFIRCSVVVAMKREEQRPDGKVMAGLYAKALERKETSRYFDGLGEVIGVDVVFEENPNADFILDNDALTEKEACHKVLTFLDSWLHNA